MEESLHRIRRALEPTGRAVPQAIAPTPSDDFDISHVVTGLWRNAWLIALCTVVAAALGYIYAFHVADVTYRSTASLVLRQDSREPLDGGGVASRIPLSAEEISTERAVVVSTTNLGEVATALGLIDDPEFNPYLTSNDEPPIAELRDEFYLTATVDELRQAIRAENLSGTTVIRVVVESLSPVKSRDIANAVIDQYQANEVALEEAARQEEIERLSARLQELQGQLVTVEAKIEDFQFSSSDPDERLRDTVELEKLGAEANAIRSLYQAMLERFSMVSVEEAPQRTESAVLDRAVLPIDNYSPREALILGASLLIGAFLGVALALARDAISDRIRGPRELGEMARRPVIAIAPKFERGKRFGTISRQFGLNQPVSIAAMESIRTSITLISDAKTRSPQVISVISGTPEEGKSPLALSLAASYAEAGTQVLLIDTDLRRRTLSKWLAPARNTGLISVLSGFIGLKDAVERNDDLSVDVLNCEVTPRNPLDLLSSEQFGRLVEEARRNYDMIILDTAPMLAVSDGRAVCKMSDFTLYVASQKQTLFRHLSETFVDLGTVGVSVDAVVLTEARHGLFDGTRKQLRQSYMSNVGSSDVKAITSGT